MSSCEDYFYSCEGNEYGSDGECYSCSTADHNNDYDGYDGYDANDTMVDEY